MKGNRRELEIVKFLVAKGYRAGKSRLSKGAFDLEAERGPELRFIQVKSNKWRMDKNEIEKYLKPRLEAGSTREVWRIRDHPRVSITDETVGDIIQARQVFPDGSWEPISLLPEWNVDGDK